MALPNTFANGFTADADDVNENFDYLDGRDTTIAASVTTEATARAAAITAEVSARNAAIAVETSARGTAVSAEATARDAAIAAALATALAVVVPIGATLEWAGAADPAGGKFLIEDGRAISRTTYAALFAAIGIAFGVGDGSTTFNIPNHLGRSGLGVGTPAPAANGGTAHTLATRAGEETHLLTTAELAAHSHSVTDPGHFHIAAPSGGVMLTSGGVNLGVGQGTNATGTDSQVAPATTGVSIQNAGSGTAHNNLPPHIVKNYIIRVL